MFIHNVALSKDVYGAALGLNTIALSRLWADDFHD
jgi:hypothetical protein